jgi:peptidoglycan/xylan/chitin deacetylase (PgdA/CDA1 family)
MRNILIYFLILFLIQPVFPQEPKEYINNAFLKKLNSDQSYKELRSEIVGQFANTPAGHWGEFVKGVDEKILTEKKIIALTFDACGGKKGSGYDKELIDFLRNERIPATLFVTGKWIDAQFNIFISLSRDTLFEIENHGLNHKPCSVKMESAYGIHGTANMKEAFDEIEANARKIETITDHRPRFYRSGTAFIDEVCTRMAAKLGITPVSYQVLSGDAVPFTPDSVIEKNVLKNITPGAIVIMHFNHPEWNTKEALVKIVPKLRQIGYTFVLLKDFELTADNTKGKGKVKGKTSIKSEKKVKPESIRTKSQYHEN